VHFRVLFTGHEAYFDGDPAALEAQLGLPPATASATAGKWIVLQPSDGPYPSIEEGLTIAAARAQILITASTISRQHRARGPDLLRLSGRIPHGRVVTGSAWLDLAPRSQLPAVYGAHGSNGGQEWSSRIAFSHWGETIVLTPPNTAVPFSALPGA